ncbi:MAG: TlyA family RNA methyltransferase [Pseudomonadota bacterium]
MRLDQALVQRGLAESRSRAQAMVSDGIVAVNGAQARKVSAQVGAADTIALIGTPMPWVSRAALKLDQALAQFDLSPKGAVALDLGASTGGFSQVLLAHGAAHVHALDVGHGQLATKLQGHPQITLHEGVNARDIPNGLLPPVDWIVSDLSFISLTKALPCPLTFAKPKAQLVALIKPQFELDPADIGKGGVVKDPQLWQRAQSRVTGFLEEHHWTVTGLCDSPIEGSDGNREFLVAATGP